MVYFYYKTVAALFPFQRQYIKKNYKSLIIYNIVIILIYWVLVMLVISQQPPLHDFFVPYLYTKILVFRYILNLIYFMLVFPLNVYAVQQKNQKSVVNEILLKIIFRCKSIVSNSQCLGGRLGFFFNGYRGIRPRHTPKMFIGSYYFTRGI